MRLRAEEQSRAVSMCDGCASVLLVQHYAARCVLLHQPYRRVMDRLTTSRSIRELSTAQCLSAEEGCVCSFFAASD
jgi:hypothetical protein